MSIFAASSEYVKLSNVVRTGQVAEIRDILDTGVDIDAADHNGATALHTAVYTESEEMAKELLDRGANPDVQNKNGQTPLHVAASNGYLSLVTILVEAGADKSLITEYSEMTALHMASKNGHTDTVQYLLDQGANPTAPDLVKKPAKFYAANQDIQEQLKNYGDKADNDDDKDNKSGDYNSDSYEDDSDWSGDENDPTGSRRRRRRKDRTSKNYVENHKLEFSEKHKRKMKLSVFDRLTRSKSKLEKL